MSRACPRCRTPLPGADDRCPECGVRLDTATIHPCKRTVEGVGDPRRERALRSAAGADDEEWLCRLRRRLRSILE